MGPGRSQIPSRPRVYVWTRTSCSYSKVSDTGHSPSNSRYWMIEIKIEMIESYLKPAESPNPQTSPAVVRPLQTLRSLKQHKPPRRSKTAFLTCLSKHSPKVSRSCPSCLKHSLDYDDLGLLPPFCSVCLSFCLPIHRPITTPQTLPFRCLSSERGPSAPSPTPKKRNETKCFPLSSWR